MDVVATEPARLDPGNTYTGGSVWVWYGPFDTPEERSADDADANIYNTHANNNEYLGMSMDVGDFNNDGLDDIAVGASGSDIGGTDPGVLRIYYGSGI